MGRRFIPTAKPGAELIPTCSLRTKRWKDARCHEDVKEINSQRLLASALSTTEALSRNSHGLSGWVWARSATTTVFMHLPKDHNLVTRGWGKHEHPLKYVKHELPLNLASQGSVTHSEESTICPLPYTWAHRRSGIFLCDWWGIESIPSLPSLRVRPVLFFCFPGMDWCGIVGTRICELWMINFFLFK